VGRAEGRRSKELKVSLPKKERDAPEWRAAMEALLLVVARGGPTMFARIGVMRALNRRPEAQFQGKGAVLGSTQAEQGSVTVFLWVDATRLSFLVGIN